MSLSRNRSIALGVVFVIAADWLSKFWVQNNFLLGTRHSVVEGWLWLTHHQNRGVSFSVLADAPDAWRLPVLAAASFVGIVVAFMLFLRASDRWMRLAAALVIAGAVGNLGDRLMNGGVTDFILVRFFPFVFNVADVAITAGAILLAARLLFEESPETGDAPSAA